MSGVAAYRGHFGSVQAERLLWRAGFGPRNNEAAELAKLGLEGAIHSLVYPGREHFVGPSPHDEKGHPLAPYDAWGHDHLWWLDRMVRTSRPLVERMALVWHDWFATSNQGVGSQRLMIGQNNLFRARGLGNFHDLLLDVTKDPAMLVWLNGSDNSKYSPNENYGREMMELFTLGAGRGYTETDVRQNALALTGFRNDWKRNIGLTNFRYDPKYHDPGAKTIFKKPRAVHVEGLVPALRHASRPPVLLRAEDVELLRPDGAGRGDAERAPAAVRQEQVRGAAGGRGDPPSSRAVRGAADGEVARPLHGGAPAPARPPDRHLRLDVARRDGRPAAVLSAERRGLGRHALARHRAVARPLVDRAVRAQPVRARSRQGEAAVRRAEARPRRRSASGASRRSARGR